MKSKYLLLTLLASAGLIAADAPAPDAAGGQGGPKADAPAGAPTKGGDKKQKGPQKAPAGVSDADWQKLLDARKATASDPAVQAAQTAVDAAKTSGDAKALTEAQGKLAEAQKAAVIKADPTLSDAAGKAAEADKKRAASGGKGKKAGCQGGAPACK